MRCHLQVGETLHEEIKVTFRFVGDSVNPEMITLKTGIQPSAAHVRGEVVQQHAERFYPTGFWGLDSSISPACPLEEHLEQLLSVLEQRVSAIRELTDTGIVPTFYCGCFVAGTTASFNLKADILRRIAEIGASLEYHIYCCDEDD